MADEQSIKERVLALSLLEVCSPEFLKGVLGDQNSYLVRNFKALSRRAHKALASKHPNLTVADAIKMFESDAISYAQAIGARDSKTRDVFRRVMLRFNIDVDFEEVYRTPLSANALEILSSVNVSRE